MKMYNVTAAMDKDVTIHARHKISNTFLLYKIS
jgi:hypothetical protein